MRKLNESPGGFWDIVARKAKIILEDDDPQQHTESTEPVCRQENEITMGRKDGAQLPGTESYRKPDKPVLRKGIGAIASSLNYIGNALEEGLNIVENKTVDIIQETRNRRSQFRKKAASDLSKHPMNAEHTREPSATQNPSHTWKRAASDLNKRPMNAGYAREPSVTENQANPVVQSELDIQLQASRNVAMAMAAKTKLLLRELKTVKADLAFAKERCAQLEEENRILRESLEKGDNPEDDELIRLQLETLLTEKARLAQENTFYARENRFLREIVEYHQLTMQDVVYLNERKEEITEVYPPRVPSLTNLDMLDTMPPLSSSLHPHPPEIVKKT